MQRLNFWKLTITAIIALAFAVSCSKSSEKETAASVSSELLSYVPADTPYVFASLEPLPDDVMDEIEPKLGTILQSYSTLILAAFNEGIGEAKDEGKSDEEIAAMTAVGEELGQLFTLEGLRGAGIGRESTSVIYGNGLLPVIRVALTDGKLMEQAIARMEAKAGEKMDTATIDDVSYRFAGDDKAVVLLAIVENDLVIGIVPANHSDDLLKSTFGLTKPAKSIGDTGTLQKIASDNGYLPFLVMLMDTTRIVETFLSEPHGANKEVLTLAGYDHSQLSDVCKDEIRSTAAVMPRMIGGYTEFTAASSTADVVFELRKDIATGLAGLVAPVQGLGVAKGELFAFGMSFNVTAIREFYAARLDALEATPYKCEHFAELQAGVANGRAMLQQPVPPIVYSIKGFFAVVDAIEGLDMATKQPPSSIDASFLLATDNPQGLLAMGQMFSPELAQLNVQPDGKPVKLTLPPAPVDLGESYLSMSKDGLAVSVGNNSEKRLSMLGKSAYADPAPFMSMNMDGGSYYGFIAESMKTAGLENAVNGQGSPEMTTATAELMESMQHLFGQMTFDVEFTERGIEMRSTAEMR